MAVNLLTIEDNTIKTMMTDPRIMTLLPCLSGPSQQLRSTAPGGKDCQRCQAEKKQLVADAMRIARNCIVNTRGAKLTTLKTLLGAAQLRVHVRNSSGKKTIYTL